MERFYPELIPHASMPHVHAVGPIKTSYYAEKAGIDPRKIYVVGIMPCTAKKFEARRPEHMAPSGKPYTRRRPDHPRIDLDDEMFRHRFPGSVGRRIRRLPLGISSGAGDIFGATGGVMEAALRTAYEQTTGKECPKLEFPQVRAVEGLREVSLAINDNMINLAVANGLNNAKILFEKMLSGEAQYHMIEIMACPGGWHRRRRPALPAGKHACAGPEPRACAPRPCTTLTRPRNCASRTPTRPSRNYTRNSWAAPTATRPMNSCIPIINRVCPKE